MAQVSKQNNYIFIHIFKTAGNSVRNILRQEQHEELMGVHVDIADVKRHMYAHGDKEFFDGAFKFTFVRNPYDWMVSLYHYIRRAQKHNFHDKAMNMTFKEWLQWFLEFMKTAPRQHGTNKYLTQYEFIIDDQGEECVSWFRMEDLDKHWPLICKTCLGRVEKLPRVNVSNNRDRDFTKYYDKESEQWVYDTFKKDFEKFGYERLEPMR